jgi:hypothetical protein
VVASFPYSSDAYRVLVGPYHGDGAPKRGPRPGCLILLPPPRGPRALRDEPHGHRAARFKADAEGYPVSNRYVLWKAVASRPVGTSSVTWEGDSRKSAVGVSPERLEYLLDLEIWTTRESSRRS